MDDKLTRDELIKLVRKIKDCNTEDIKGQDSQMDWINILKKNVPDPRVSDYIFWPRNHTSPPRELTPEEIVDKALSYKPFFLAPGSNE